MCYTIYSRCLVFFLNFFWSKQWILSHGHPKSSLWCSYHPRRIYGRRNMRIYSIAHTVWQPWFLLFHPLTPTQVSCEPWKLFLSLHFPFMLTYNIFRNYIFGYIIQVYILVIGLTDYNFFLHLFYFPSRLSLVCRIPNVHRIIMLLFWQQLHYGRSGSPLPFNTHKIKNNIIYLCTDFSMFTVAYVYIPVAPSYGS